MPGLAHEPTANSTIPHNQLYDLRKASGTHRESKVIELLMRVTTVSPRTQAIVNAMLDSRNGQRKGPVKRGLAGVKKVRKER